MRSVDYTRKFKKEFKRCLARGLDQKKFNQVVRLLATDQSLPIACRPHKLSGKYIEFWECHIAPDWLLIYHFPNDDILELVRTGSHSDLF